MARTRGKKSKKDRDLDRLALLERLSGRVTRGSAGEPGSGHSRTAESEISASRIARYSRFRAVADVLLVLSLCVLFFGVAGIVIEVVAGLREDGGILETGMHLVVWALATATSYGLLKGMGELLLLVSDMAELYNTTLAAPDKEKQSRLPPA